MARPLGSPNKATAAAREAFNALLDRRFDDLNRWIDQTAAESPRDAFYMVMDLARYCVARPAAVTVTDPVELPPMVIRFHDGTVASCTACGHSGRNHAQDPVS